MADKSISLTEDDVRQKIDDLRSTSTSVETKKLAVELLLNLSVKNKDFAAVVKNNGILVLSTLFKTTNDFDLRTTVSTLLLFLSVSGQKCPSAENLMNDVNTLSLINFFLEKDFGVLMQVFGGLKVLGDNSSKQGGSSSKPVASLSLSAAILFLENIAGLINPSSNLLTDNQKSEILVSFIQFVLTGTLSQAAADAGKDSNGALDKSFAVAYQNFVKAVEGCQKGDFSNLDNVAARIVQLVKENKLIADVPIVYGDFLGVINTWLGGSKKFILIYKASKDGFAAATFHTKCDNKGPTVVVITCTQGNVFGGYTPLSWAHNGSYKQDDSKQSFIFSLKNPRNEQPKKYPLKNPEYSINATSSYGPTFGGGHDIYCSDNSNANSSSYTYGFGHSYDCAPLAYNSASHTAFTGARSFTAKEIEVYQVQ